VMLAAGEGRRRLGGEGREAGSGWQLAQCAEEWKENTNNGDPHTAVCKMWWCLQQLLETLQCVFLPHFAYLVVFAAFAGDGLSNHIFLRPTSSST
jgi:hypothetical protein